MNDLIRIVNTKISDAEIKTVNARELHVFLDSGQEFANWIKSRIADFGFIDGQDFLTILSKTPNGGRPSREYYISLDMAKELSMVERNFLRTQQTQDLVNKINHSANMQSAVRVINGGENRGTYVCKQLVIAYGEQKLEIAV